ncbi:Hypothetical protein D9617_2g053460 [Elsinoe fawcettii]|nr:Hypothetical protein D9617_2g053460 [Elsinoe fawcettii]
MPQPSPYHRSIGTQTSHPLKSSPHFLSLPLEIRYRIYRLLDFAGVSFGDIQKTFRLSRWKVPDMLHASTQIRQEMLACYSDYRFRYEVMPIMRTLYIPLVEAIDSQQAKKEYITLFSNSVLDHIEVSKLQYEYTAKGPIGNFNVDFHSRKGKVRVRPVEYAEDAEYAGHSPNVHDFFYAIEAALRASVRKRGGHGFALEEMELGAQMIFDFIDDQRREVPASCACGERI